MTTGLSEFSIENSLLLDEEMKSIQSPLIYVDDAMLEPDNVNKKWCVQVSLSLCFYGNQTHQSGLSFLGVHTPTTWLSNNCFFSQ